MPRYDDSPPMMDRRDRHMKSPLMDRRRRDSPPMMQPRLSSRDHMVYHHDDYRSHRSEMASSEVYKILCVSNISNKYPDSTVRNEMLKEFSRFGDPSIRLKYDKNTRLAFLYFNSYDDAREARYAKSRLVLFDKPVVIEPIYPDRVPVQRKRSLTPEYSSRMRMSPPPIQRRLHSSSYQRSVVPDRYQLSHSTRDSYRDSYSHQLSSRSDPYQNSSSVGLRSISQSNQGMNQQSNQQRESKKDKFPNYLHHIPPEEDDKATRTLFVGNLEVTITEPDLRRFFERYGVVEDVDVKRPPPGQGNAYAFIKFLNLDMAHRAKVEMSGQYIGKFQCKIGYGKATPSTRIWVGGLGSCVSFAQLDKEFDRFGAIRKIDYVKGEDHAYIQYDTIDAAQAACAGMRGYSLGGNDKRLRVDYAEPALTTSPKPAEPFNVNGSPRSNVGSTGANGNGEFWPGQDGSSPKRRRAQSPNGDERSNGPFESIVTGRDQDSLEESINFDGTNGKSDIKVTINESVTTVAELIKCCPPTWTGGLLLKSSGFATRMYFCSGDIQLVDLMKDQSADQSLLRITQRLRLEPSKLDDVTRRVNSSGSSGYCILIASQAANLQLNFAACGSNASQSGDDSANPATFQQRPIRNLVTYLKSKSAAGVVLLSGKTPPSTSSEPTPPPAPTSETSKGVLYLFPPHSYSVDLIKKIAPNINSESAAKEDYLVVVLVRGSN